MAEYVDKQATIADLNKTYDAMTAFHPQFYAGYQFAVNRLRAFPTADVAPVRHGEWKPQGIKWKCSCCGVLMSIDGTPEENLLKFCPNCGANVRGADNGE